MSASNLKTTYYHIKGLHCASCQLIIEKTLIKIPEVDAVDVNLKTAKLMLRHEADFRLSPQKLNEIFKDNHYRFSLKPFGGKSAPVCDDNCAPAGSRPAVNPYKSIFIAFLFIAGFILLSESGFSSLVSVNAQSSLPVFFFFGLLAGFSSCAALTGSIVLSLSKQWLSLYSQNDSFLEKAQPHFLFNAGRLLSYLLFGAALGWIGNFFRLSPVITAAMVIGVSLLMILLGLQMLGLKALANFRLALPSSLTGGFADESRFQGKFAPLLMGALTFFLPCGFTITAQALALASGYPLQGALIMGLFALGTLPGLLVIGLSSVKFYSNPKVSAQFSLIAGALVLFFAAFNINSQLAVLGAPNLSDLLPVRTSQSSALTADTAGGFAPIVDGKQLLKMDAYSYQYSPNKFKVKAGEPVRFEITDKGTSGCTNAVMSRALFDGQIDLVPGTTSVKEFMAPLNPGIYKFSCWMGMVSGTIEVVDTASAAPASAAPIVESGAKGCGCGGAGGSCGMAR